METNQKSMSAPKFTAIQPKEGDVVLHCGHLDDGPHHFFQASKEVLFVRPDGTQGRASWLVVCNKCFMKSPGEPDKVIRGDGIWKGNLPAYLQLL